GSAKCLTLRLDGEEAAGWRGEVAGPPEPAAMSPGAAPKVLHLVLLKFKPGVSPTAITDLFTMLRQLQQVIPGLEQFSGGANTSPEGLARGYTHGFVMTFQDAEARDGYLPHPEHENAKQALLRLVDDVLVVDLQA